MGLFNRSALITAALALALVVIATNTGASHKTTASGYNRTFPVYPLGDAGPRQIQSRLSRVIQWLRANTDSKADAGLLKARATAIANLEEYRAGGFFPMNEQHTAWWAPSFIDSRGAICAVGYLIERTAGRGTAEYINTRYHANTIQQINDPVLTEWIANSGLTYQEVVAIQEPGWRGGSGARPSIPATPMATLRVVPTTATTIDTTAGQIKIDSAFTGVAETNPIVITGTNAIIETRVDSVATPAPIDEASLTPLKFD